MASGNTLMKRKQSVKSGFSSKWQPVAVDLNILSSAEFDSFGGLEELTDYKVIRGSDVHKICSVKVKVKKKEVKASKIAMQKGMKTAKMCSRNSSEEKYSVPAIKQKSECANKKRRISLMPGELGSPTTEQLLQISKIGNSCRENKTGTASWLDYYYLPEEIVLALQDLGFEKPTLIQELVFPHAIRDHKDILGAAETGSGKTLAFGIPIVTHILNSKRIEETSHSPSKSLKALVLTPTRELAIQVKDHLAMLLKYTDIKIAVVIGGLSTEKQQRILKKCPHIVVATPGRLWKLMEEGNFHLSQVPNVRYLVIDEADRMVEKGHFAELAQILELMNSGKDGKRRQTFIFSATLTAIHELPKRILMKKQKIRLEKKQRIESLVNVFGMKENPKVIDITRKAGVTETLVESRINCTTEEKDLYLYYFILMYPGRTLVFCNSISSVRRLKAVLELLGCNPLPLHSSMHQRQRLKNTERFKNENILLLATDVAARGIDIKGIEHVVHFQVPHTAEVYIHRSGRTARVQNEGLSLMLIDAGEKAYYGRICRTLNKVQPLSTFPVDHNILNVIKERVTLARQIDQMEHKIKRLFAQNRWFTKAAQDMDVDIADEKLLNDLGNTNQHTLQLKIMKKQLQVMLKRTIIPKSLLGCYPTKSGKLIKSLHFGAEKAYDIVKKKKQI